MMTIRVEFGKSLKNRIASFMHKHGLIRIAYEVPVVNDRCEIIGAVYTLMGNKAALWLTGKIFGVEKVVQPFSLAR